MLIWYPHHCICATSIVNVFHTGFATASRKAQRTNERMKGVYVGVYVSYWKILYNSIMNEKNWSEILNNLYEICKQSL